MAGQTGSTPHVPSPASTTVADEQGAAAGMEASHRLILLFAGCFAIFLVLPPLLGRPFPPYPLLDIADVFDLFTPLVLIPLYWLLLKSAGVRSISFGQSITFLVLAALWVEGQGMHLSANSIHRYVTSDLSGNAAAYFYDEVLGHFLWHVAAMGLSAMVLLRQWREPAAAGAIDNRLLAPAVGLYGVTYFAMVVEGQTPLVGVPFAIAVSLFGLVWCRPRLWQQPLLSFLVFAHLLAVLLFAAWGAYWGGLPEFSSVGLIG
jgi:hypothetical protein